MGNLVVVVGQPLLGLLAHFGEVAENVHVEHAAPEAPLKRSMKPFCMGRPGSMKSNAMPLRSAHSARASAMNSGPLSKRSLAG